MMNETVSTIMTTKLITLSPEDKLSMAAHLLTTKRIHHLPIVLGRRLVGLLTTHDLYRIMQENPDFENIQIKEVMTTRLATLGPNDKVGTVAEVLLQNLFHALPIVDAKENLLGLVTSFDLLKYNYTKEYPNSWWLKQAPESASRAPTS